jgi:tripartite-type tricarboxylate transporter receptor subunit TctC
MNETWGQPVVVENRGGAGGGIGMEHAAKAAPDGHTLVIGNIGTLAINPALYPKLAYDPLRDYAPIALVAGTPLALIAHPSLPARSLKELIALARARPGEINFASAGSGGPTHLAGELFNTLAGIRLVHVPYKGNAPAITALLSGESQLMFSSPMNPAPFVKSGRLRALAVSYERRIAAMPEVPTAAEAGMPGLEVSGWYGVLAPAATPRDIVAKLNAEIVRIARLPEVREYYLVQGIEPMHSTPEQFAAHIKAEIARWGKVVKASGARVD